MFYQTVEQREKAGRIGGQTAEGEEQNFKLQMVAILALVLKYY